MLSKYQCWRCDQESHQGKTCNKCRKAYYCSEKCCSDDKFRHNSDCNDIALRFVCHGCGKTDGKMMMCSNCMNAWFCGEDCLKKVFKTDHKKECKEISTSVKELAKKLHLHDYSAITNIGMIVLYYFGNCPAVDLLNTSMNEGREYSEPLRLLLCGVGDPRNVCLTISNSQPAHRIDFVLNDISDCTLARTVLLLYMLCKVGPDKAESVVQVWYSLHLSQQDHELVISCLEDLVRVSNLANITRGNMKIDNAGQFTRLNEVWKTWLSLSRQGNNLSQQRSVMFGMPDAQEGMRFHLDEIPRKHSHSMDEWFKNGVLLSEKKRKHARKENITLMGLTPFRESFEYSIGSDCMPFCCWDYKDARAVSPEMNDVNEMYNRYITDVLKTCAERLQSDQIHISFLLCDCIEVPTYIQEVDKFDRITTSNLWDYIPLPRLLTTLKPLLNPCNMSATILTEAKNWVRNFPLMDLKKVGIDWMLSCIELRQTILQDTGDNRIAQSQGYTAFKDYISYAEEFTCFVRASLLDLSKKSTSLIPSLEQLAAEFGFKPRDFVCHGNTISPFRWKLNCRRITLMRGTGFSVEWKLV